MDYDILNCAISNIIDIVNEYNKQHLYDVEVCEDLVIALTGYYLTFGPEIFSKISEILQVLEIHTAKTSSELIQKKRLIKGKELDFYDAYSEAFWEIYLDPKTNKFIGAKPHIFYKNVSRDNSPLELVHELSHALEGCTANIIYEDDKIVTIKRCFGEITFDKETGLAIAAQGTGMTELTTATIENKILRKFCDLDSNKIDNPLIKDYVKMAIPLNPNRTIASSYVDMVSIFKDLVDNDQYFDILRQYYYETNSKKIIEEFNCLDYRLNFQRLINQANTIFSSNEETGLRTIPYVQQQLTILNEATNAKPSTKQIILLF